MSRAFIVRASIYLLALATLLLPAGLPAIRRALGLFFDGQAATCLPWRMFISRPLDEAERTRGLRGLHRGELVTFHTDAMAAVDPRGEILKLKMLAALPGDRVAVKKGDLTINGHYWGRFPLEPWIKERGIKPLPASAPWWRDGKAVDGEWVVPDGMVMLLGTEPLSFDSRYWGWQSAQIISGRAWPIF